VEIRKGTIFINDKKLEEPYITASGSDNSWINEKPIILSSHCFFVVGDNRPGSFYKSIKGHVDISKIKAKVLYIYMSWNPHRIGKKIQ